MTRRKKDAASPAERFENARWPGGPEGFGFSPDGEERWSAVLVKHCEAHKIALPTSDQEWNRAIQLIKTWTGLPRVKGKTPKREPFKIAVLRIECERLRERLPQEEDRLAELQSRPPWSQMISPTVPDRIGHLERLKSEKSKKVEALMAAFKFVNVDEWDKLLASGDWKALERLLSDAETEMKSSLSALASSLPKLGLGTR